MQIQNVKSEDSDVELKIKRSEIALALSAFSSVIAILYHIGFWSTFKINIFQYMPISELLISSVYPLSFVLLPALLVIVLTSPGHLAHNKNVDLSPAIIIVMAFMVISYIAILFFINHPYRYVSSCALLSIILLLIVDRVKFVKTYIKNTNTRISVLALITLLPITSFGSGVNEAKGIIETDKHLIAKFNREEEYYKYIGMVGGYVFVSTANNHEIRIRKISGSDTLSLTPKSNSFLKTQ